MEKEKKPIYKKWWFWLIIVIVIIGIIGSTGTETDEGKTTLTSGNTTSTKNDNIATDKTKYKVGEIYEDNNVAIKYVSVDENFKNYNKYATIKSGHKVVKAEFEFENISSTDQYVSSFEFTCYADGYDCENFYSIDDASFSSNLSAGKKTKGNIYFEVPKDAKEIIIEYETNWLTSKKIEFIVK